jgi:hypothetical protein
MGAREYDPSLGRWLSADSIVPEPGNPQSFNRYAYVLNNPLRYVDPTGHFSEDEIMDFLDVDTWEEVLAFFEEGGELEGRWGWLYILRQANVGDKLEIYGEWDEGRGDYPLLFEGRFAITDYGSLVLRGTFYGGKEDWEGYETGIRHEDAARWGSAYKYRGYFKKGPVYFIDGVFPGEKHNSLRYDFDQVDKVAVLRDVGGIGLGILEFTPVAGPAATIGMAVDIQSLIDGEKELDANGWPYIWDAPLDYAGMGADAAGLIPGVGIGGDVAGIVFSLLEGVYYSP